MTTIGSKAIKYLLHIQNPFNMNEFDDLECDQPFQPFTVGDQIAVFTFKFGTSEVPSGPTIPVVAVRRGISKAGDAFYDETWIFTDEEWVKRHP